MCNNCNCLTYCNTYKMILQSLAALGNKSTENQQYCPDREKQRDLAACARVHGTFRTSAQRLLFRELAPSTSNKAFLLRDVLALRPDLALLVQTLILSDKAMSFRPHLLKDFFDLLPNLRQFEMRLDARHHLVGVCLEPYNEPYTALLKSVPAFDRLQSFTYASWTVGDRLHWQVLRRLPNLKRLALHNLSGLADWARARCAQSQSLAYELHTLELVACDITDSVNELDWLLGKTRALVRLVLRFATRLCSVRRQQPAIEKLLSKHAPSLRDLDIGMQLPFHGDDIFMEQDLSVVAQAERQIFGHRFPNLQYFALSLFPANEEMFELPFDRLGTFQLRKIHLSVQPPAYHQYLDGFLLPKGNPTVSHSESLTSNQKLTNMLRAGDWPCLQQVLVEGFTSNSPFVEALRGGCRERSVSFRCIAWT